MISVIRKLELKDAIAMANCLNDSDNMKYLNIGDHFYSVEECCSFIRESLDNDKDKHFAIVNELNGWVGTISLKKIDFVVKQAEFAIITSKSVHGKGYAQAAVNKLLEYAFNTLALNRVYLNVIKDNVAANKFYRKCGFIYEGTFRQTLLSKGVLYDLNWYSILKEEFVAK